MRSIRQNDDGSWSIMDKREGEVARFHLGERVRIRGIKGYAYQGVIEEIKIDQYTVELLGHWDGDHIKPFPPFMENIEYIKAMTVLDAQ